jgi:hypothetical protein
MSNSFFSRNFSFKHWLAFFALAGVFLFFRVGNVEAKVVKFLTTSGAVYISGNLGIGTSNPVYPLTLGTGGIKFPDTTVITSSQTASVSSLASAFDIFLNADSDANGSGSLISQTKGIAKMFLNNLGNIGIGTTNPVGLIHTYSNYSASPGGPYNFAPTGTGSAGTVQTWIVPATGTYTIDAYGAQGGTGAGSSGGLGARIKGDVYLVAGTQLKILVGQAGGDNASYKAGGGGGGTFVAKSDNTALVVAGGGGGGGGNSNPANGQPGLTTTSGGTGSQGVYAGGAGGSGGGANGGSAGGAGFSGNGVGTTCSYIAGVPASFINGGAGGAGGTCAAGGGAGGFGGGSGGEWCCMGAAGAGGGYSGGGGTDSNGVPGGGGSYNSGTNQTNTAGAKTGAGSVSITWAAGVPVPAAVFMGNVGISALTSIISPLSFGSSYSIPKMYLFDDGTSVAGFGSYSPDTLRIFGDSLNKKITFGSQTRAGVFSEMFRIDNSNVGIGVTSPKAIFHSLGVTASPGGPYTFNPTTTSGPTGTIQSWTVPMTGTYTIDTYGAQGGGGGAQSLAGGSGARAKGDVYLTAGTIVKILVGQVGGSNGGAHGNENGGGGGTFVVKSDNTPLVIAGGGGGAPSTAYGLSCTRNIANASGQSGTSGSRETCLYSNNAGGTGGGGGTSGSGGYNGGSGGGFSGNGGNGGTHCAQAYGGQSYLNGGVGGSGNSCYTTDNAGGFGGGGGGQLSGPGGGGGYSGGAGPDGEWSSYSSYGGGGGSYNSGTNQVNTTGARTGAGLVTITWNGGVGGTNIFEGNFGINQTNPSFKFDVSGNGKFTLPVIVSTPTGSNHATTLSYVNSALSGGDGITIGKWIRRGTNINNINLDNVGIGTTNPRGILHSYVTFSASPGGPYTFNPTSTTGQTGTIQTFTVPKTGTYTIEAYGAEGGSATSYSNAGGKGARMKGDVVLTAGEVIKILVGQKGGDSSTDGMGGGGTFVVKQTGNTPVIIAGGGGGASYTSAPSGLGMDAVVGTTSTADRTGSCPGVAGPAGGSACANASGGGGLTGNGGGGSGPFPGLSYTNGGTGGSSYTGVFGGFGGGGGTHGGGWGGGGGGGYAGGSAYAPPYGGGGGSSYNSGSNQSNSAGVRTGAGLVTITWNGGASAGIFEGNVGIGTTNPLSALHINTTSGNTIETLSASGSGSAFSRYTNVGNLGWALGLNGTTTAFQLSYASNDTPLFGTKDYLTILNSGNVGLGLTNPLGIFHSKAGLGAQASVTYNGSSGNNACTIQSWTVPSTGTVNIEAWGGAGSGGDGGTSGSAGAKTQGDFALTAGQVLYVLPGGYGYHSDISSGTDGTTGGSGGASTVVVVNPAGAFTMTDAAHNGTKVDILISAAGGGGGSDAVYTSATNGAPGYGNLANTVYTNSLATSFLNGGLGSYYARGDGYSQGGCGGGIGTDDSAPQGGGYSTSGNTSYSYNVGTNKTASDASSYSSGKVVILYQLVGPSAIFEGNIGIGTTSPAFKLDTYGTGRFTSPLIVATPTGLNHAATKSYVDSKGLVAQWITSSNNISPMQIGNVGIGNTNPLAKLSLGGSFIVNRTPVADANYTALASDYIIAYTSLTANRTVTLPNSLCSTVLMAGKVLDIVDESGSANTGRTITIDPEGATTILGQPTFTLGAPYNSVMIYCNGTNWRMN